MQEKYEKLAVKYLGTDDFTTETKSFHDRKFSPKGWQYRQNGGNHQNGKSLFEEISKLELLEDNSRDAKNDHDMRFYNNKIFRVDENQIVWVSSSQSRSGKSTDWSFVYISRKNSWKTTEAFKWLLFYLLIFQKKEVKSFQNLNKFI